LLYNRETLEIRYNRQTDTDFPNRVLVKQKPRLADMTSQIFVTTATVKLITL